MKFDDVISHLGQFGPYQRRVYALICIPSIAIGMQTLATVFTMAVPDHRCIIPGYPDDDKYHGGNSSHTAAIQAAVPPGTDGELYSACQLWKPGDVFGLSNNTASVSSTNITTKCSEWVYDTSVYESTLITKLDLVCENKLGRSHVQMFFMLGSLFGTLLLGPPADYFGRRKVMMMNIVLHLASSIAVAFTPNFVVLCLFMMVNGASMSALYCVLFVIGMEFVGPKKRVYAGYVITLFFGVGVCILVGAAYFLRDWQHLQLAITSISLLFLAYYWLVPESPRWLVNTGRYTEAERILRHAAAVNKRQLPEKVFQWDTLEVNSDVQEPMWHILKYPRLLIRTLVIFLNWMVCSMTYYGISLNVADLAGSIYLNMLLYGIVEVVSYILCIVFLEKLGRRRLHLVCMFLSGVCCTLAPLPLLYLRDDLQWINVVLAVLGKAGVSAAFATIWLYTTELFPTVVRNGGVSASSFCAKIGGISAPYIANLSMAIGGNLGRVLPLLIFGIASLSAGSLALLLPETSNRTLPDSLADANRFGGTSTNKKMSPKPIFTGEMDELQPVA